MRVMILGSLTALLVTAAGTAALKTAGLHLDIRAALVAMIVAIVASIVAAVPLILVDRRSHVAMMQAGLLATVIHMMILLLAAGIVLLGHLPVGSTFIYWLAAMYATTLLAVVGAVLQTVRAAAPMDGKA